MRNILSRLAEQKNHRTTKLTFLIGGLFDMYSRLTLYYSMLSFVMIAGLFYNNIVSKVSWLNWLTIQTFIAIVVPTIIIVALIEWKILIPMRISYANYRNYQHGNKIVNDIQTLENKIDNITKLLKELKNTNK